MIRVSWDLVILWLCVVYTHPSNVLGWLEYLWILGYSDIGRLCGVPTYCWILGYSDREGLCGVSLVPRPSNWGEKVWYTLFAHAH